MIDNFRPRIIVNTSYVSGEKTIGQFGVYEAEDDGYDGYSKVTCLRGGNIASGYRQSYQISDMFTTNYEANMGIILTDGTDIMNYRGVTTTELTNGSTTSPIVINSEDYTPVANDYVDYTPEGSVNTHKFVYNGTNWYESGIVFTWDGGSYIGATAHGTLNLRGAQTLRYSIVTRNAYGDSSDPSNDFELHIGVSANIGTGFSPGAVLEEDSYLASLYQNQRLTGTLDISDELGDMYLFIKAPGWNLTVEELEIEY